MWSFSPLKTAKKEVKIAYLALANVNSLILSATQEQMQDLIKRKECCILSMNSTAAKFHRHCERTKAFIKI